MAPSDADVSNSSPLNMSCVSEVLPVNSNINTRTGSLIRLLTFRWRDSPGSCQFGTQHIPRCRRDRGEDIWAQSLQEERED